MAVKMETTCDACGVLRNYGQSDWERLPRRGGQYGYFDVCPKCYSVLLGALDKIIAKKGRSP